MTDKMLRREALLAKIYTAIFYQEQSLVKTKLCDDLEDTKRFLGKDGEYSPKLINLCISAINDTYSISKILDRLQIFTTTIVSDFTVLLHNMCKSLKIEEPKIDFIKIESVLINSYKIFDRYLDKFEILDKKIEDYLFKIYLNNGNVSLNLSDKHPTFGPIFTFEKYIIKDPFDGSYLKQADQIDANNECMSTVAKYAATVDDLYNNILAVFPNFYSSLLKIAKIFRLEVESSIALHNYLDEEYEELESLYSFNLQDIFEEVESITSYATKKSA